MDKFTIRNRENELELPGELLEILVDTGNLAKFPEDGVYVVSGVTNQVVYTGTE